MVFSTRMRRQVDLACLDKVCHCALLRLARLLVALVSCNMPSLGKIQKICEDKRLESTVPDARGRRQKMVGCRMKDNEVTLHVAEGRKD